MASPILAMTSHWSSLFCSDPILLLSSECTMRHLRTCTAFLLTVSIMAATSAHASARFDHHNGVQVATAEFRVAQGPSPSTTVVYTYHDGKVQGEGAGNNIATGGNLAGGLGCGFLLGFIGTGIVYFATGPSDPSASDMAMIQNRGMDFQRGYIDGYKETSRKKKRGAALGGGLLGTLFFVVLVLNA
jgi:hypothetical protein